MSLAKSHCPSACARAHTNCLLSCETPDSQHHGRSDGGRDECDPGGHQWEAVRCAGIVVQFGRHACAHQAARSIKYQLTIAKLPLAKEHAEFDFAGTPVNEGLARDLARGDFLAQQRNVVLVGGTGTGKTHLAIAIARSCIRGGARGRCFNVVDLVNRLEAETRGGRQGRIQSRSTNSLIRIFSPLLCLKNSLFHCPGNSPATL